MKQSDVVVIGGYNHDVCWSVDKFPSPGQTVVGEFTSGPGGKGSNQAIAAARAGAKTAFVGAVGDDHFGRGLGEFYQAEGIEARLTYSRNQPTGCAGIWINSEGRNDIIAAPGANQTLTAADLPTELIANARVVVCQYETCLEVNRRAFQLAREAGAVTILNPSPLSEDFESDRLEAIDVLIVNESEFVTLVNRRRLFSSGTLTEALLTELSMETLQPICRGLEVAAVIVTVGARGCYLSTGDHIQPVEAIKFDRVIDTTGAGDAFLGGFAAGCVRFNGDYHRATQFGQIVAGLSVTRLGAARSMPRLSEIEHYL